MLNDFKAYPDAWLVVDQILQSAQNPNTKFFGLQILDEAVNVSEVIFSENSLLTLSNYNYDRLAGKFYLKIKKQGFATLLSRWCSNSQKMKTLCNRVSIFWQSWMQLLFQLLSMSGLQPGRTLYQISAMMPRPVNRGAKMHWISWDFSQRKYSTSQRTPSFRSRPLLWSKLWRVISARSSLCATGSSSRLCRIRKV